MVSMTTKMAVMTDQQKALEVSCKFIFLYQSSYLKFLCMFFEYKRVVVHLCTAETFTLQVHDSTS